jgi:hypothetical protein
MRPDEWRRPTEEMGKIPKEIQPHLSAYNSQVDSLTTVLMGKVNFPDNFNAQTFSISAVHNVEEVFKSTVKGTAKRMYIDWTSNNAPWCHSWRVIDSTTVGITVYWTGTPGTASYTVKGVIFGE